MWRLPEAVRADAVARTGRSGLGHPHQVRLVVDDLVSFDPFIARGIRVYGVAEQPFERVGFVGPGVYIRVTPTVSWSWNMAGEPAGDTWYESRRALHGHGDRDSSNGL
ncbi:hypothetical protein GCM10009609_57190 [Pseudonocardia aurantiaca]|uniref:Uncharacterized protein n=1 Tax=Pseudonocardia aurantiaca TaxID=75290 RepID=A0ABW4FVT1_9PSEU